MNETLRFLSGTDLALVVREITGSACDPALRHRIDDIERSGAFVTLFEVIEDGTVLFLVHSNPRPTLRLVRRAYERHMGAEGGAA